MFYFFVAYIAYLLLFGCRQDYSGSCAPTRYTCDAANLFVYPAWNHYFQPHLEWIDQQTGAVDKLTPAWQKTHATWAQFDENYAVSYTLDKYRVKLQDWADIYVGPAYTFVATKFDYVWARALLYYKGSAGPILEHYFNTYNHHLVDSVDNTVNYVKRHTGVILGHASRHSSRFLELQVFPALSAAWTAVSTNGVVLKIADATKVLWVGTQFNRLLDALVEESSKLNASFRSKSEFIKGEFKSFTESGIGKQRRSDHATSEDVLDVVKTILEDVTSVVPIPESTDVAVEETAGQEEETALEKTDDYGVASTVDSILSEVISEVEGEVEGEEEEVEETSTETESTLVPTESENVDESEEETDFQTETIWLTATVYEGDASDAPEKDEEVATVDHEDVLKYEYSPQAVLEQEIIYWRSKVDQMLKMAYGSLEDDMIPVLNATLDPLRDEISANFTKLQQSNYDRYKRMNILISKINKDFEHMKETNELIENPVVDRQKMRDEISECKEAVEQTMKDAEDSLNAVHAEIVTLYFAITQETVDVIESYAETLLTGFTNSLSDMIGMLESDPTYEDKFGWAAWKEHHKIKELIFQLRDKIFDEANKYKENHRGGVKPRGLAPWIEYLGSINFHINFLIRDNDEYLQLVRAKANVAYQMREGITRQLEDAKKEKAEAAKKAKKAAEEARKASAEAANGEASFAADANSEALNEAVGEDAPHSAHAKEGANAREDIESRVPGSSEDAQQAPEAKSEEFEAAFIDESPEQIESDESIEAEEDAPEQLEADLSS